MPLQTGCYLLLSKVFENVSEALNDRPLKLRRQRVEAFWVNLGGEFVKNTCRMTDASAGLWIAHKVQGGQSR